MKQLLQAYFAAMDSVHPIRAKTIERELRKYAVSVEIGPMNSCSRCEKTLAATGCDGGMCDETKASQL